MTNREAEIFQWITENPMISQEELAAKAGIARSSAAVHISNLIKKGYILGKGYVTNGPSYCTIIGGANIDIGGTPCETLAEGCDNQGKVTYSLGGAGRNIAHNLRLLGVNVKLITALGDDTYAHRIIDSCNELGIEIADSLKLTGVDTATYLYIADENRKIRFAVSDMKIYDRLTTEFVSSKLELMNRGRMVILDTTLPAETIAYVCEKCKAPVFVACISAKTAKKLEPVLDKLCVVTANKAEAEVLSGISIKDRDTLERAADIILEHGVKNVFIDAGKEGVYCGCDEEQFMLPGNNLETEGILGIDDAFAAGMTLGYMKRMDIRKMAKLGQAAVEITVAGTETVNPQLCVSAISERTRLEL